MLKIDFFYLALGLFIGIFVIYLTNPQPEIIIKHPNLSNIESTVYVDEEKRCYKYYAQEIQCPVNKQIIRQ